MIGVPLTENWRSLDRAVRDNTQVNTALAILSFIAYYTEISLWWDQRLLFPNFGPLVVSCLCMAVNRDRIARSHITVGIAVIGLVGTVSFIGAFMNRAPLHELIEISKSFAQFSVGLFTAYGVFLALAGADRKAVSAAFFVLFLTIVLGSQLEKMNILRGVSDRVRGLLYDPTLLYAADVRDLLMYGDIRPKFFAREPSLVGISAGFALAVWVMNWRAPLFSKAVLTLIASAIASYIIRSPTIAMIAMTVLTSDFLIPTGRFYNAVFSKVIFGVAMAMIFLLVPVLNMLGDNFGGRFLEFISTGSIYMRLIGPAKVAFESWYDTPLFGVGLGGFDSILATVRRVYSADGAFNRFPFLLRETNSSFLISNAFWEFWIFFGALGGVVVAFAMARLVRTLGARSALFPLLAFSVTLQNFGGLSTYRCWFFLLTFTACTVFFARANEEEAGKATTIDETSHTPPLL